MSEVTENVVVEISDRDAIVFANGTLGLQPPGLALKAGFTPGSDTYLQFSQLDNTTYQLTQIAPGTSVDTANMVKLTAKGSFNPKKSFNNTIGATPGSLVRLVAESGRVVVTLLEKAPEVEVISEVTAQV